MKWMLVFNVFFIHVFLPQWVVKSVIQIESQFCQIGVEVWEFWSDTMYSRAQIVRLGPFRGFRPFSSVYLFLVNEFTTHSTQCGKVYMAHILCCRCNSKSSHNSVTRAYRWNKNIRVVMTLTWKPEFEMWMLRSYFVPCITFTYSTYFYDSN